MKRNIAFLLSIFISCSLLSSTFAYKAAYADSLQGSQKKLDDVNQSIDAKKDKLNEINSDKQEAEDALKHLDEDMHQSSTKLKELNEKVGQVNLQIEGKEVEIQEKKQELAKEQQLFKERVRALYKQGSLGYLEVVMGARNFSDLLDRIEVVKTIIDYDKNLLASVNRMEKNLEYKKSELEKGQQEILVLKDQVGQEHQLLQAKSTSKMELVAKLEKDKSYYENQIAKEQEDSQTLTKIIQNMKAAQEAAKKKAAEEERRKAEQKKQNQTKSASSKGSNSTDSSKPSGQGNLFCVTGTPYAITSDYGMRYHPVLKYSRLHAGIDIGVSIGTPVYALEDGEVIYSGEMSGYGNVVMINHGDITSVYGHNSSLVVKTGQAVKGGELISYSGNSGVSSGPHLHFEIRDANGNPIAPYKYYVK